jgi:hypothetical protein
MPGERRAEDRDGAVKPLVKRTFLGTADRLNAAQVLSVMFAREVKYQRLLCVAGADHEGSLLVAAEGLPLPLPVDVGSSGPLGNHGISGTMQSMIQDRGYLQSTTITILINARNIIA